MLAFVAGMTGTYETTTRSPVIFPGKKRTLTFPPGGRTKQSKTHQAARLSNYLETFENTCAHPPRREHTTYRICVSQREALFVVCRVCPSLIEACREEGGRGVRGRNVYFMMIIQQDKPNTIAQPLPHFSRARAKMYNMYTLNDTFFLYNIIINKQFVNSRYSPFNSIYVCHKFPLLPGKPELAVQLFVSSGSVEPE